MSAAPPPSSRPSDPSSDRPTTTPSARSSARPSTRNKARTRLDPVRLVAWQTLRAVDEQDAYANLVLPANLRQAKLTGRDAAFATELTYGTLRGRGSYDAVLDRCSDRPTGQIDPPLLDALRLGVHQLLATRVAAHAAVGTTVDLVRAEIGQGAAGFANAVLRRVAATDRDGWMDLIAGAEPLSEDARLAVRHSHPEWIVRALRDSLRTHGRDIGELEALLAADNVPAAVTLCALPGLCEPGELRAASGSRVGPDRAIASGEEVTAVEEVNAVDQLGSLSPFAVRVDGDPGRLRAVRERRARVQDAGSQLVTLALADAPLTGPDGGRWLDLCAGPGGKAALLAAVLAVRRAGGEVPADARLVANEVTGHRAELVRSSLAHSAGTDPTSTDTTSTVIRIGDGRDVEDLLTLAPGGYDRVLVDAPCTGLGALRRRPEARWRRRPADLATLGPLQRDLLRAALDLVRPGGVVGYVTCSPHPAETVFVVADVLRSLSRASNTANRPGGGSIGSSGGSGGSVGATTIERVRDDRQLWPHVEHCDAMYLALLRKAETPLDTAL